MIKKWFQYTWKLEKDSQKIKIKYFINKYNWRRKNYPTSKVKIPLNVLYAKREGKMNPAYISKHKSNCEKQVILYMISNGERWHCLSLIKLSSLLRGITSKCHDNFYCLNCFHLFRTKNKFQCQKSMWRKIIFGCCNPFWRH